jgi:hypothetical protein
MEANFRAQIDAANARMRDMQQQLAARATAEAQLIGKVSRARTGIGQATQAMLARLLALSRDGLMPSTLLTYLTLAACRGVCLCSCTRLSRSWLTATQSGPSCRPR